MGVYPGSTVMVMQWAVLLYLAIGPALLQYAAAIARDLSAGRPSAARFGLPRGWVSLACAVILFGGILGSVRTVAEFFPYFIGSNYMAILFLFPAGTMPLAGAVWVVGLLSPIHFLVVNLEAASEQGSQNG
jgi:hypothetical protein